MKRAMVAALGFLVVAAALVRADWAAPTSEQIAAAAADPGKLPALLQGANDSQVASVIVQVLQLVATATPPAGQTRQSLVSAVIAQAMQGRTPESAVAIARSVGTQLGVAAVSSQGVRAISGMVQTALAQLPQAGPAIAYTTQFNQTVSVPAGTGGTSPADIRLPGVTQGYRGQH